MIESPDDWQPPPILLPLLQLAVPLWIEKVRDWDVKQRLQAAYDAGIILSTRADSLRFRDRGNPKSNDCHDHLTTADVFNTLAKGLACAAFTPGGIEFFGQTWNANPIIISDRRPCMRSDGTR